MKMFQVYHWLQLAAFAVFAIDSIARRDWGAVLIAFAAMGWVVMEAVQEKEARR